MSIDQALAEINGIAAQVMTTGAVDSELEYLRHLERAVAAREMTPQAGVAAAQALEAARQNYH